MNFELTNILNFDQFLIKFSTDLLTIKVNVH